MSEIVEEFKGGRWYEVIEDYDIPVTPLFKLKTMCYELRRGDELRFRGPNLGRAEFFTVDGRLVILRPKVAFRVVGKLTTVAASREQCGG